MPAHVASTTKWERTGEPGSAFNGLSSRGRGSRGRGGHRGGRGGSRANPTEQTTEDNGHPSKDDPQPPSVADKPSIPPTTHSKVIPPRKPSRGDPPPLQAPVTQTRSANRRRRPQVSQHSAIDPNFLPLRRSILNNRLCLRLSSPGSLLLIFNVTSTCDTTLTLSLNVCAP
jgi:hypothetical protein